MLVVVAVVVGAFLLARGFDGAEEGTAGPASTTTQPSDTDVDDDPDSVDDGETDDDGADNGGETDDPSADPTTSPATSPPVVTKKPGDVKIATVNGTGERGRAGRTAEALNVEGFVTAPKNSEQDRIEQSVIYYRPGYSDDAKSVAEILGTTPALLAEAPVGIMSLIQNSSTPENLADFNIYVLIGTDGEIPDPSPPSG